MVVAHTITLLMISAVPQHPDLLFLLHDVARLLRYEADRRASAHGMTRAQWIILFWLERQPGLSQKELAEILEVEPITVARLIDRLEAREMVERRPDPRDRRIWRLHLLPSAAPVLAELKDERTDMHRMLIVDIDEAVENTMIAGLQRMKATLLSECKHKGPYKDVTVGDAEMKNSAALPTTVKESV
jgi:MarR family transcriptional regulator, transcriptional regulator for hemolysin